MKVIIFTFSSSAIASQIVDQMIASYPSEFIYVVRESRIVKFTTDFPVRTRKAVKKIAKTVENF